MKLGAQTLLVPLGGRGEAAARGGCQSWEVIPWRGVRRAGGILEGAYTE